MVIWSAAGIPHGRGSPMPRYVAFLRGVSPVNARMAALRESFEAAGFSEVRTVLSSGNVLFTARSLSEADLAKEAETAMQRQLGRTFLTIVRPVSALQSLLADDPYGGLPIPEGARRVVTFLRTPPPVAPHLPIAYEGAHILAMRTCEAFTVYVPNAAGPSFMTLIEKTFGTAVTTRTWDTVRKCAFP